MWKQFWSEIVVKGVREYEKKQRPEPMVGPSTTIF